jgi:hypothetical protein
MQLPRPVRACTALALASGALALPASSASAATLTPSITDFGSQKIGTKSAVKSVTLTTQCVVDMGLCVSPDTVNTSGMNVTGPFGIAGTDCPPTLMSTNPLGPTTCRIDVVFTPKTDAPVAGKLTVDFLSAQLKGTGKAKKKKKCKKRKKGKKRSAAAAKKKKKKCKRKKKKKK